MVGTVEVRNGA